MEKYLWKLCDGDPQKLAVMVGATSQPTTSSTPEPDEDPIPYPDADELQEPDELSLANAIIANSGYAEGTQAETTQVSDEEPVQVASSSPGVEAAAAFSSSPDDEVQCEQQQTPVKPPWLPPPMAIHWFPVSLQCHRPLSFQMCSLHIFTREGLRHARATGKASSQGSEMMQRMNTQLGVMAAEMCQMYKLQQKQCELQEQQLELQCKDMEVHQKEL